MVKDVNNQQIARKRASWRDYQNHLKRSSFPINGTRLMVVAVLCAILFYALYTGLCVSDATSASSAEPVALVKDIPDEVLISKNDVQLLLQQMDINDLIAPKVDLPFKGQHFRIDTSIDSDLQNKLLESMDRKNSRYIGVVVMEADTGKVLAMAGFDKVDPQGNPCLSNRFPAASLFKIVTAAAAVDQCNYTGKTTVRFNGYKHTLYKNQLKDRNNQYTNRISFANSFAQSINPVFGKIGTLHLGKKVLEEYGSGFGFNQPIDFELPVPPSQLHVKDAAYNWAEIASGFNNDTTVSPIHAALMVSAVLNQGRMVSPSFIERIADGNGRVIYRPHASYERRAMTSKASAVLTELMETTVKAGTARSTFRGQKRDPVLSRLKIGGKTGSIFNRSHDVRFDWFAGFAEEKKGHARVIVAAVVGHEEYIGTRAGTYARKAMTYYFKNQLARHDTKNPPSGG